MIKILIADDHDLIRVGLKKVLGNEIDFSVVGEVCNSNELFDFLKKSECDLIILDINMPGKTGLDILAEIKNFNKRIKILILTIHPEERYAIRALKSGASGYITKSKASTELVRAIRKIIKGRKYISEAFTDNILDDLAEEKMKSDHKILSDREFQVFILIAKGNTITKIAGDLCVSVSSVNTYRLRIMEKMEMKTNMELMHYAIKKNLVD